MPKGTLKKSLREKEAAPSNRRRLEKLLRQMLSGELNFPGSAAFAGGSTQASIPYRRIVE